MNTDRNPTLLSLFDQAEQEFEDREFAQSVMREINRKRRKILLLWLSAGAVAITCLALVATPLVSAVELATRLLPVSLVEVESEWLRQLVSPINSVAAAIALGFLALRKFFHRIFR